MRLARAVIQRAAVAALALCFMNACGGEKTPLVVGPDEGPQPLAKLVGESTAMARAVVVVTLTDGTTPVEGATVAFTRSIAGRESEYAWEGITDADGKARIEITVDARPYSKKGASGYYQAKATDGTSGDLIGTWGSIPIGGGREVQIALEVGGSAEVTAQSLSVLRLSALHDLHRAAVVAHDVELLMSYFEENAVYNYAPLPAPLNGTAEIGPFFSGVFGGFPDFDIIPGFDTVLSSGNILVAEHSTSGTHQGEFMGIPATGQSVVLPYLDIKQFEGNKLAHVATYVDGASQMIQMGVMPAPGPMDLSPSFVLPASEGTGLATLEAQNESMQRWNDHDMVGWAEMIREDADLFHAGVGMPVDRPTAVALQELYILAFPDAQGEVHNIVDLGSGWVVCEAVFTGTHEGPYFGVPATGNSVAIPGAWLTRVDEEGAIVYWHFYMDTLTIMAQLGLL